MADFPRFSALFNGGSPANPPSAPAAALLALARQQVVPRGPLGLWHDDLGGRSSCEDPRSWMGPWQVINRHLWR